MSINDHVGRTPSKELLKELGEDFKRSIEEKKDMIEVIYEVLEKYNLKVGDEKIKKALDPYENVKMRDVIGGPAPKEVERRIKAFKERLDKYEKEVNEKMQKINKVKETLLSYEI